MGMSERAKLENWTLSLSFTFTMKTKKPYPPLVGSKIGEWTILQAWVSNRNCLKAYVVQCSCGRKIEFMNVRNLKLGGSLRCKSCAISIRNSNFNISDRSRKLIKEVAKLKKKYDKDLVNKLCSTWKGVINRSKSKYYIAKVYTPWTEFTPFFLYCITLDGYDNLSLQLDRKNTLGNYEPNNLRFVTPKGNMRNRSDSVTLLVNGEVINLMDFIEKEFGIIKVENNKKLYDFVYARLKENKSSGDIILLVDKEFNTEDRIYGT